MLSEVLAGVVGGYLVVTLCESVFHRILQHASPRLRRVYRRLGGLGREVLRAWHAHHVVHHYLTFRRDHVTQFVSAEERARLDAKLRAKGHGAAITRAYGARIGPHVWDFLYYVTPTLPIFAAVCWAGGTAFTAGAMIPFVLWPALAQWVHPCLHMPYAEIAARAPWPVQHFARSWYFRRLAIHHWVHHRYEQCNYNLLMGGDWLLGQHRRASARDLVEMRRIGLWTP